MLVNCVIVGLGSNVKNDMIVFYFFLFFEKVDGVKLVISDVIVMIFIDL